MERAAQYRQFAETLTLAARDAGGPARELILRLARTWSQLAEDAEAEAPAPSDPGPSNVVDLAAERRRRR